MRFWASAASLTLAFSVAAEPATARLHSVTLDDGRLNATFILSFSATMNDALDHGIDLNFALRVRGATPGRALRARLSWQPLSRRYVLQRDGVSRGFALRESALRALGEFKGVLLSEAPESTAGLGLRFSLERGELPAPLRIPAYLSSDWRLDSGWVALDADKR